MEVKGDGIAAARSSLVSPQALETRCSTTNIVVKRRRRACVREKPDEAAVRQNDLGAEVDRLEEEESTHTDSREVVALLAVAFNSGEGGFVVSVLVADFVGNAHAGPEETGHDEEDGGEEEGVVVAETGDCERKG
jgi:hypothetical protein